MPIRGRKEKAIARGRLPRRILVQGNAVRSDKKIGVEPHAAVPRHNVPVGREKKKASNGMRGEKQGVLTSRVGGANLLETAIGKTGDLHLQAIPKIHGLPLPKQRFGHGKKPPQSEKRGQYPDRPRARSMFGGVVGKEKTKEQPPPSNWTGGGLDRRKYPNSNQPLPLLERSVLLLKKQKKLSGQKKTVLGVRRSREK